MRTLLLGLALAACPLVTQAQPAAADAAGDTAESTREPASPLTLEAALALSASRHPDLAAAIKEVDALQGAIMQAGARPNPDLGLRMEDLRPDTRTTIAEIGIPLELGGKRAARLAAAEQAQAVAQAALAARRARLRAATVAAFFDALVAQEGVRLAQGTVQVAGQALDVAGRRVAAGKAAPLEATRARVERANAQLALAEAGTRLDNARRALAALWGNTEPAFSEAVGDLDTLPARASAETLARALDQAPELVLGRQEIERRRSVAAMERSKRYPDVRLTIGAQRDYQLGLNQAIVGVSIPLPLFDRNQGNLYEATVRADQARDDYRAIRLQLDSELRQAAARLAQARESARTLRTQVLPGAQEAYDVASKGFEAGKFGFLDVLDAQRTLYQSRMRYLAALADTYQAAIAIDRILGR